MRPIDAIDKDIADVLARLRALRAERRAAVHGRTVLILADLRDGVSRPEICRRYTMKPNTLRALIFAARHGNYRTTRGDPRKLARLIARGVGLGAATQMVSA